MTATATILDCPDCGHPWDRHLPGSHDDDNYAGGCAACRCTEPRRVITPAERVAAIRAQLGNAPLTSTAQDRANGEIGGAAWSKTTPLTDQTVRGGTIVERYITTDAEPGLVCVSFAGHKGKLAATTARLLASECEGIEPSDRHRCYRTARQFLAVLGQRQDASGPPLNDVETRYAHWLFSLLAVATGTREGL